MGVRPMGMQPAMGMQQPIGMQPAMGMQQPMMYGMQPVMGNMMSQPRPPAQTNQDPFGALWDSFSNHYSGKCKKIYYRSWSLWVFNRSPWKTKYCGDKVCACYLLVQATVVFDVTINIMSYSVDKYLFVLHLMTFLNRLFLISGRVCEPEIGRDQECASSPWQPSTSTFLFNPYLIYACEKKIHNKIWFNLTGTEQYQLHHSDNKRSRLNTLDLWPHQF